MSRPSKTAKPNKPTSRTPHKTTPPEVINPIWLIKAIGVTVLAALVCGYLTFCLLFYQGQWQLVLHPTRITTTPQSINGVPYQLIHFGPDESAIPQLTGCWIPSEPSGRYAQITILFLPSANGSLADSIPTLAALHNLGINVFAFDYRGYGQSAQTHPSQQKMTQDAESAWQYLTVSRSIAPQQIIPYGIDAGASLATTLAATHPTIPALILESPRADLLDTALRDPRASLLPVRLLFHERFPLADPLTTLRTPKLLITKAALMGETPAAFRTASDPKLTVDLSSPTETLYLQTLTRFLDQYLPLASVPQLVPSPAPSSTNPH